ncbi:hypothetical protein H9P43_005614 [Blastocladiella emersonii ATCC 22665]|nr:hypothetical protein H9P43_005614 [Blastocladiella emersonii ATCC 22665]
MNATANDHHAVVDSRPNGKLHQANGKAKLAAAATTAATAAEDRIMWTPAQIVSYYASYAAKYDEEIDANLQGYPAPFVVGSWIVEYLCKQQRDSGAAATLRVLDLGCGTGQSSRMFFQAIRDGTLPLEVHGVDATSQMLERASGLPFTDLQCANVEERLPYADATFDAVISIGVFDFITRPVDLLRQVRRITKRGDSPAVLGITLPERSLREGEEQQQELNGWTRGEMETMLREAGWWVERHERLLGYEDSQTGEAQWYRAYLLVRADGGDE